MLPRALSKSLPDSLAFPKGKVYIQGAYSDSTYRAFKIANLCPLNFEPCVSTFKALHASLTRGEHQKEDLSSVLGSEAGSEVAPTSCCSTHAGI